MGGGTFEEAFLPPVIIGTHWNSSVPPLADKISASVLYPEQNSDSCLGFHLETLRAWLVGEGPDPLPDANLVSLSGSQWGGPGVACKPFLALVFLF